MEKSTNWKTRLQDDIPDQQANEIDQFEAQIERKRQGAVEDKVFAETRLRRGVYGQRYDNGKRHDGAETRDLVFPCGDLTKGPETVWDAPGMQRIKIPFGGLNAQQMDVLADLAEEYSDAVLHVTTRQDLQLHYVHIDDTPDLMRRLAAVDITTQEACGNSVRNVTACVLAGVCQEESFDVTPYSRAMAAFLLGHPDCQDFGRKFKIAFSGCREEACGLVKMHDLGFIAQKRVIDGVEQRGFEAYVGGGLGAVPRQAKLMEEWVSEADILPLAQAICRVFARMGEKRVRSRARIKFLVDKLGIDEFQKLVREECSSMPHDSAWTDYLEGVSSGESGPLKGAGSLNGEPRSESFSQWLMTNVYTQRQSGYGVVTVHLPLGDLSSFQMRGLSDIARKYVGDNVRTTVEQNIVFRWVCESDYPDVFEALDAIGLSDPGAGTVVDITACPGTDTCKLGISASRGLAGQLRTQLAAKNEFLDDAIKNLKIKISGCFNSCGQHHISDLGFYGASRKVGIHSVPHFQVVIGGKWKDNAGSYGLAVGSVPSKTVPKVVEVVTERFVQERQRGEVFQDWVARVGKKEFRAMLEPFMKVPAYDDDPELYTDWNDPREFSTRDMGVGECAGEIVSLFSMEITKAESEAFEAQLSLDDGDWQQADKRAYQAMLLSARALIRTEFLDLPNDPQSIVDEFHTRFYATERFFDKYAGPKFADYLFARHQSSRKDPDRDSAHTLIEESLLFIEATHACENRLTGAATGGVQL